MRHPFDILFDSIFKVRLPFNWSDIRGSTALTLFAGGTFFAQIMEIGVHLNLGGCTSFFIWIHQCTLRGAHLEARWGKRKKSCLHLIITWCTMLNDDGDDDDNDDDDDDDNDDDDDDDLITMQYTELHENVNAKIFYCNVAVHRECSMKIKLHMQLCCLHRTLCNF